MRPLLKRFSLKPIQRFLLSKLASAVRSFYSLDGVDDRFIATYKAIDVDGDIDIEWMQSANGGKHVFNQNISATNGSREFTTYIEPTTGRLLMIVGGVGYGPVTATYDYRKACKVRLTLSGNEARFYANDVLTHQQTLARGSAREPMAQTTFGCRTNNTVGSFSDYFLGQLWDVKINGTKWPIDDRKYKHYVLSEPKQLSANLTLNPTLTGSTSDTVSPTGWAAYNTARFAYDPDGALSVRNGGAQAAVIWQTIQTEPGSVYIIDVDIKATVGNNAKISINSGPTSAWDGSIYNGETGTTIRIMFIALDVLTSIALFNNSQNQNAYVTYNKISVSKCGQTKGAELVTNGSFDNGTNGWVNIGTGGNISVVSGEAQVTGGTSPGLRQAVALTAGKLYLVRIRGRRTTGSVSAVMALPGLPGLSVGSYNSTQSIITWQIFRATGAGNFDIAIAGDGSATTWRFDHISLMELDYCQNMLIGANTNDDRWTDNSYQRSLSFNDAKNTQYLPII